jgi:hypothetical protein
MRSEVDQPIAEKLVMDPRGTDESSDKQICSPRDSEESSTAQMESAPQSTHNYEQQPDAELQFKK